MTGVDFSDLKNMGNLSHSHAYKEFGIEPKTNNGDPWPFLVDDPWDRQPKETDTAWAAFQVYISMEPDVRSVVGAYRKKKGWKKDAKAAAPQSWQSWFAKFRWKERAAAWDAKKAKVKNQAELSALAEQAKTRVQAYTAVMRMGLQLMQSADVGDMEPEDARRFIRDIPNIIEMGASGQRVEVGQPQRTMDVNVRSEGNPAGLTVEKLEAIVEGGMASGFQFELPPGD